MKKCLLIIITLFIISLFLVPISIIAVPALTQYENYLAGGGADSTHIYGSNWYGMQFTTGTTCHTVSRIDLSLKKSGTTINTVTVELYVADTNHFPTGIALTSGTLTGDSLTTSYLTYPCAVSEVTLSSSIEYVIVVKAVAGNATNYILWQTTAAGGIANAVGCDSTTSGYVWVTTSPVDAWFAIYGNPAMSIVKASVFNDYDQTGDLYIAIESINVYEPYYSNGNNPSNYFQIRLMDVAGTTVLASYPYYGWGDTPHELYISAANAVALTDSAPYIVQIYGMFSPYPTASYTLTPADWEGSNMHNLDDWVLSTARHIEKYTTPNTVLLVASASVGEQLNSDGAVIFDVGMPSLRSHRPNLFNISHVVPVIDNHTPTSDFNTTSTYQIMLGTTIASFLDDTAAIIGLPSGKDFGAIALFLVYLVAAIFFFGKGQFSAGLGLAFPILGLDAYARLLDIQWIIGLVVVFAVLFVWSFWWTRV